MRGTLCIADVWSQVLLCVVMHFVMDGRWTVVDFGARVGFVVPVSLTLLHLWRAATGDMGWVRQR